MKLNVAERIALIQVLPKEGDFVTLKVLRDLQDKIGFSEKDHKKFKIVRTGDQMTWGNEGMKEVEIEMGEKAIEIIKESLTGLDKEKTLRPEHVSLYEKFIQDKGEKDK